MNRYAIATLKVACAAILGLGACQAGAQTPKPQKLTYATFYGSNDFYETSAKYFMDEVTKRTNGRITFEPYYGGSLLKTAEMSSGLASGAADIASAVPAAFNPREFPLTGVVLPFISENPPAVTQAFSDLYQRTPALQQEYLDNNQRLLWALGSGENTLWTNKPIHTAEDLKGARVRAITGVADAIRALGGTPISIPWVEALELVQRGGAEGVSGTPFNQAIITKVYDMAPHASNAGRMGVYTLVTWAINQDTWKSLDPEAQKVITEVAAETPKVYFDGYRKEVARAVELARATPRMDYVRMDEEEAARWKATAQPAVNQKWMDTVRGRVDDPQKFLDDFIALTREHEAQTPYTTGFDQLAAGK
ncbi:TRAP transporter substrate-binding protein DctP [Bordetella sp. BOR01]|uniref:TRAP transporter substrate-binding protein DctP n=1 Tax=Bordetella sp. BOR01 TaxID=2854779 RepID=UPI001C43B4F0|nr:TRAP transporter substrate-binding protein DctP [Bordetella sp. BOR01]